MRLALGVPAQVDDGLQVKRLREEVEQVDGGDFVAALNQRGEVASQRGRLAGDIRNARGTYAGEVLGGLGCQSGTGRIEHDKIRGPFVFREETFHF